MGAVVFAIPAFIVGSLLGWLFGFEFEDYAEWGVGLPAGLGAAFFFYLYLRGLRWGKNGIFWKGERL